uniref:Uncharacterized protein n=1 Tax=Trichogramma kaykai TaxID=54128 RepID=A0ABD2XKH8_9HYME
MKSTLLVLALFAVSAFADILPGDPRYGTEYHREHHHAHHDREVGYPVHEQLQGNFELPSTGYGTPFQPEGSHDHGYERHQPAPVPHEEYGPPKHQPAPVVHYEPAPVHYEPAPTPAPAPVHYQPAPAPVHTYVPVQTPAPAPAPVHTYVPVQAPAPTHVPHQVYGPPKALPSHPAPVPSHPAPQAPSQNYLPQPQAPQQPAPQAPSQNYLPQHQAPAKTLPSFQFPSQQLGQIANHFTSKLNNNQFSQKLNQKLGGLMHMLPMLPQIRLPSFMKQAPVQQYLPAPTPQAHPQPAPSQNYLPQRPAPAPVQPQFKSHLKTTCHNNLPHNHKNYTCQQPQLQSKSQPLSTYSSQLQSPLANKSVDPLRPPPSTTSTTSLNTTNKPRTPTVDTSTR